jgi:hypothetical protein
MMVEASLWWTLGIRSCCTQVDPQSVVAHLDPDPQSCFVEHGGPSDDGSLLDSRMGTLCSSGLAQSSVSQIIGLYARVKPSFPLK